ncbi:MAG: hypothetical protein FJW37_11305 [Acidobacteria bacterium]|nr:hypothetical protein [Acidobacteriota bacterium]
MGSLAILLAVAALAQQAMPRMTVVEPDTGKIGAEITVKGENLAKENVAKVYLTDGKNDLPLDLTGQAATEIKFKIPAKCQAGRFSLMLLTTGNDPKLIEQPVRLTVEQ